MSIPSNHEATAPVGESWRAVRQRWYIVVGGVLGGAILGWWFGTTSPIYEAEATVQVAPVTVGFEGETEVRDLNIATEAQVAASGAVIGRAVDRLGTATNLSEFSSSATVRTPPDSSTLVLSVSNADPGTAAEGAEAWATEYLAFREDQAESVIDDAIRRVDESIDSARQLFTSSVAAETTAPPGSAGAQGSASTRRLAEEQLSRLVAQRTSLETASTYAGRILTAPEIPTEPANAAGATFAAAGSVLGLLAGLVLAIAMGRSRRMVSSTDDLPPALQVLVTCDLSHDATAQNETELAALVERFRRLQRVDVQGLLLVSVPGAPSELNDVLADRLRQRGVDVEQVRDPAVPSESSSSPRPTVALVSCRPRDPWTPVLASSASLVVVVAVVNETMVKDLRSTQDAVWREAQVLPNVVLVRPTGAKNLHGRSKAVAAHTRPMPSPETVATEPAARS